LKKYCVYIFSDKEKGFHFGLSNDMPSTLRENENLHQHKKMNLVFYEMFENESEAEKRYNEISHWLKRKIIFVVDLVNPLWEDWTNQFINNSFFEDRQHSRNFQL
jgi:predicted GIY-YIG superfamily endonuclease